MRKNTICLWYDKDAEAAARFYAATFPDSAVSAVRHAPSDYPGGKKGEVLTVDFTVLGIPCLGLNGGPVFKHNDLAGGDNVGDRVAMHVGLLISSGTRQTPTNPFIRAV